MIKNFSSKLNKFKNLNIRSKIGFIFLICITITLVGLTILAIIKYDKEKDDFSNNTTCACVFDFDNTITCGLDLAKSAIDDCKKRGCKLAFNTARAMPYYEDIKLEKLGLTEEDVRDNLYHGDWLEGMVSSLTREGLVKKIADTKSRHMKTIQNKFNILDPKKVILFDDVYPNITNVREKGFSAIHANHRICGLNERVKSDIAKILDN